MSAMKGGMAFFLLTAFTVNADFAYGQITAQEKQRAVASLTNGIERAIRKYQGELPSLREKVVSRMSECGFLFKMLGSSSPDVEVKRSMAVASEITQEVSVQVSKSVELSLYKNLVDTAITSATALIKRQNRKETLLLLRNCKSFNEVGETDQAVQELTF